MSVLPASQSSQRRSIDLNGPEGNAFFLLSSVSALSKGLYDKAQVKEIMAEMQGGNYTDLVRVFCEFFGEVVDIILTEQLEKDLDYGY